MELKELKAQAYDILAAIEFLQKQLVEVNGKISVAMKAEPAAPVTVETPKE